MYIGVHSGAEDAHMENILLELRVSESRDADQSKETV
jgi:hypothetical protein